VVSRDGCCLQAQNLRLSSLAPRHAMLHDEVQTVDTVYAASLYNLGKSTSLIRHDYQSAVSYTP
jgi:hypothetical protein